MTVQPRVLAVSVPTVRRASSPTANANVPLCQPAGLHTFPSRMNLKRRVTHLPRVPRLLMDSKILKSVVFLTSPAQSTALGLSIKTVNASAFLRALTGSVTPRRAQSLMNNLIGPQPRALSRSNAATCNMLFDRTEYAHVRPYATRRSVTLRRAHCLTSNLIGPQPRAPSRSNAATCNMLFARMEYAHVLPYATRRSVTLRRAQSLTNNLIGPRPRKSIAPSRSIAATCNMRFGSTVCVHACRRLPRRSVTSLHWMTSTMTMRMEGKSSSHTLLEREC